MTNLNQEPGNFLIVENSLVDNINLSDGAFRLYCRLARKPQGYKIVFKNIAKEFKYNKNTISKFIAELKEKNLLISEREKTNTGSKSYTHTILGNPKSWEPQKTVPGINTVLPPPVFKSITDLPHPKKWEAPNSPAFVFKSLVMKMIKCNPIAERTIIEFYNHQINKGYYRNIQTGDKLLEQFEKWIFYTRAEKLEAATKQHLQKYGNSAPNVDFLDNYFTKKIMYLHETN